MSSILKSRRWIWDSGNPHLDTKYVSEEILVSLIYVGNDVLILFSGCNWYRLLVGFEYRLILSMFYD